MAGQSSGPLVVGVDLGGTKILSGVVDADNNILGRAKRSTPAKEGGRRSSRRSSSASTEAASLRPD